MSKTAYRSDLDFGSYDDDYRGFDMREDEGSRGPLILALAIGVLLVFGAVVWNTYRQGVRIGDSGLPVITADASAYKSTPEDAGGFEAPDLNKRIYDQLDGAERPITIATAQVHAVPTQVPPLEQSGGLSGGPPTELRPSTGAADPVAEQAAALNALADRPAETTGTQVASIEPRLPIMEPVATVSASTPTAPQLRFVFDSTGDYMVQIAAFRSQESAETAWRSATASLPAIYDGAEKHVQRADLGAKGIFFRLRAGSFSGRSEATAFCDALKAENQQCIVVH